MSDTPKYFGKIKEFILKNNNLFENISEYDQNPNIESSPTLKMIYKAISETDISTISTPESNLKYNESVKIKAIHSKENHPLLYYYFTALYNANLIKDVPDIYNFSKFYSWYNNMNNTIDYNGIDREISKIKSKIDDYKNNENINTLITLHDLINNTEKPRSILHSNIYRNRFVSLDIQQNLESINLVYENIKIKLDDNSKDYVNINLFYPDNNANINMKPDIKLIHHIIKTMDILHKNSKCSSINNLDLTLILSTQKKMLNNTNLLHVDKQLSAENINSGSTYPGRTVLVWRLEELYKVLIHELIHFHCFDFGHNHPSYDLLEHKLENVINFEGTDSINEAYTETLATIINSMFSAYYISKKSPDKIEYIFHKSLDLERKFLVWQVSKIVHMFGGDDINIFLSNKIIIKQTTSVRSYFIYKLFLLFNLTQFIGFIDKQNEKCGINICDRLEEFGNLINTSYEMFKSNKKIIDTMNNCIKLINNEFNKNSSKVSWIYKTCRMTATEIK